MNDSTPCSKFFPCHFSKKGEKFLKTTDGTVIQDEMQVIHEDQAWDQIEN